MYWKQIRSLITDVYVWYVCVANTKTQDLLQKSLIETLGLLFDLIRSRLKESKPSTACTDDIPWMITWGRGNRWLTDSEEKTAEQQTQVGSGFAFFTSLVVFAAIRGENVSHRWCSGSNSVPEFSKGKMILSQRSPLAKICRGPASTRDS